MNFTWEIEYLQKRILTSNDQIAFMHGYREALENCPFELNLNLLYGDSIVAIKSLDQLHEARDFMRKLFGKWEDRMGQIWCAGDDAYAAWKSKDQPGWSIRLSAPVDDFPKELLPDESCGFVPATATTYSLQCEV